MFRSPLVVVLIGATCITALHGQQANRAAPPAWKLTREAPGFWLESSGLPTAVMGSTVAIRAAVPTTFVSDRATFILDAEPLRLHRVTLTGELQTIRAETGAWLFLDVHRTSGGVISQSGYSQRLRGDAGWRTQSISIPVPPDATSLVVGLALSVAGMSAGEALVTARNVRFARGEPLDPATPIAAAAKNVLDTAFELIRANAMNRNRFDARVETIARTLASGAVDPIDVYPAIRYVIDALGDGHSLLLDRAEADVVMRGGAERRVVGVNALADNVVYMNLPGYVGGDPSAIGGYVTGAQELIAAALPRSVCGWVLDLRENDGGNVGPMREALSGFLDAAGAPRPLQTLEAAPVAILIGPRTASAGEAIALSFVGRPRSRSFGSPTAGQTTVNRAFPLPDGGTLALTVRLMSDRTGRAYGGPIDPEQRVTSLMTKPGIASADDELVVAAVEWLRGLTPFCVRDR